jgi:hypothetical protein
MRSPLTALRRRRAVARAVRAEFDLAPRRGLRRLAAEVADLERARTRPAGPGPTVRAGHAHFRPPVDSARPTTR